MEFLQNKYAIVHNFIPQLVLPFLYKSISLYSMYMEKGDHQVPGTPKDYKNPISESILVLSHKQMEQHTGLKLLPTYSYLRIYRGGDTLAMHTDREACEVSATINIGADPPGLRWPIWIESDGSTLEISLEPGSALLYRGCDVPHWRNTMPPGELIQVFLHYVDANGPHKDWVFDKRGGVGIK